MKLDANSFFIKKFLQYDRDDLPSTICQLGRRIFSMTLLWAFVASILLFLLYGFIYGNYTIIASLINGNAWDSYLRAIMENGKLDFTALGLAWGLAMTVIGGIIVAIATLWSKEQIETVAYNRRKARRNNPEAEEYRENRVWTFIKGIYARIHDKTCGLIEYENLPKNYYGSTFWDEYPVDNNETDTYHNPTTSNDSGSTPTSTLTQEEKAMIRYTHVRKDSNNKPLVQGKTPRLQYTIAYTFTKEGNDLHVTYGIGQCRKGDTFSRRDGRSYAESRLDEVKASNADSLFAGKFVIADGDGVSVSRTIAARYEAARKAHMASATK